MKQSNQSSPSEHATRSEIRRNFVATESNKVSTHTKERSRLSFGISTSDRLSVIERRLARSIRINLHVIDFGDAYIVKFESSKRLNVRVISAALNTIRRSDAVGIFIWDKVIEPNEIAAPFKKKYVSRFQFPDMFAFSNTSIYNAFLDGENITVLCTDNEYELEDVIETKYFNLENIRYISELIMVAEIDNEVDLDLSLSELYKKHSIPLKDRELVTQAIISVFEAARTGQPFAAPVPRKMLDPDKTEWPKEKYSDARKEKREDIEAFLRRVWKPLIDQGATRSDLRRLDYSADMAIANFTRVRPDGTRRSLPSDLHLPTKKELNDELLSAFAGTDSILEGRRLSSALYRRSLSRRQNKNR